ncbi:MAG: aminoacyl-histidine dipeptidase [Firmicutes bacterium]|nr:aminoacyl-histidine dipeptidase [Bacillota bacterium]
MKQRILTDIEPRDVLGYFEDLTFIPRESGNEQEVSDFLVEFAKKNGLEVSQDEYNNVLIRKDASEGYEDHPGVILQAHMDMVCEKNPGVEFDFAKDPIEFEVDGDIIIARDTSLGADNGVGVAMAMAILANKDLKHPPLEFLCTTDEESGMLGIENFDFDQLKGDRLINIDSSDEAVIVAGCAGGPDVRIDIPVTRVAADPDKKYYNIKIEGLRGGHSGEDIHLGRANANKLLSRYLNKLSLKLSYDIADIGGGLKSNAIPRNAFTTIGVAADDVQTLLDETAAYGKILSDEYRVNDPDIQVVITEADVPAEILDEATATSAVAFISFCETGIIRMDQDYPEFVETSNSIGVVELHEDVISMLITERSSLNSGHEYISESLIALSKLVGGTYNILSNSPVWAYQPESEVIKLYAETYEEMFGRPTKTIILHAGIETGMFALRIERELDMISLGPDNRNLHSPGEWVSISSTERVYKSIVALLEKL